MLKIYDTETEIPEDLREHYNKRGDGKYEPAVEGINSIGGLLAKRDELLDKVKNVNSLTQRVKELEAQETLPDNHVAVPKDKAKLLADAESLGDFNEIKTKLGEYDSLKAKELDRELNDRYSEDAKALGLNPTAFARLAKQENLNTVRETVKENGKDVTKVYAVSKDDKGKDVKRQINLDYVKESAAFAPFIESLTATDQPKGQPMFRQGVESGTKPTLEDEVKAAGMTGRYSL